MAVVSRWDAADALQAVAERVDGVAPGRAAERVAGAVAGGVPGVAVGGIRQAGTCLLYTSRCV